MGADKNRGLIRRVRGRDAKDHERGLPRLSEIEIEMPDGRIVSGSALPAGPLVKSAVAQHIAQIAAASFNVCPICFGEPADSREHVPPKAFGGRVMTLTCTRCNNAYGTRAEAGLQDWYDNTARVYYKREGHQAPFGHGQLHILTTAEQEFVAIHSLTSRNPGADLGEMMGSDEGLEMHVQLPSMAEVRNGLLKSAYLAAALHLGGVPDVPSAREIRAELVAVVEQRKRSSITDGPRAQSLRFFRTGQPAAEPTLALVHIEEPSPGFMISLARTILVDWPFPEVDPVTRQCR